MRRAAKEIELKRFNRWLIVANRCSCCCTCRGYCRCKPAMISTLWSPYVCNCGQVPRCDRAAAGRVPRRRTVLVAIAEGRARTAAPAEACTFMGRTARSPSKISVRVCKLYRRLTCSNHIIIIIIILIIIIIRPTQRLARRVSVIEDESQAQGICDCLRVAIGEEEFIYLFIYLFVHITVSQ